MFVDCVGKALMQGDRVGVAFSYSRASVGWIKVGTIEELTPERFLMRWENGDVSRPMKFDSNRMVLL